MVGMMLMTLSIGCTSMLGCSKPTSSSTGSAAASNSESSKSEPVPRVVAIAYPLQYLTARVGGEAIEVVYPVPQGELASQWKPTREDILAMQRSDLVVANGPGARFAKWMEMTSIPSRKIVNSATKGLSLKDFIEVEDVLYTHSHGDLGEHSHPTNVAYTWLNPEIALKQAEQIGDKLKTRFPQHSDTFEQNLKRLSQDLEQLKRAFFEIEQPEEEVNLAVLTINPELKFFTRAAGWDDLHLKWFEPPEGVAEGGLVGPEFREELLEKLAQSASRPMVRRNGKLLMLSTYTLPEGLQQLMDELDIHVVVIEKMDQAPTAGDYLTVTSGNIDQLR